jgi:hypothetical protein
VIGARSYRYYVVKPEWEVGDVWFWKGRSYQCVCCLFKCKGLLSHVWHMSTKVSQYVFFPKFWEKTISSRNLSHQDLAPSFLLCEMTTLC